MQLAKSVYLYISFELISEMMISALSTTLRAKMMGEISRGSYVLQCTHRRGEQHEKGKKKKFPMAVSKKEFQLLFSLLFSTRTPISNFLIERAYYEHLPTQIVPTFSAPPRVSISRKLFISVSHVLDPNYLLRSMHTTSEGIEYSILLGSSVCAFVDDRSG